MDCPITRWAKTSKVLKIMFEDTFAINVYKIKEISFEKHYYCTILAIFSPSCSNFFLPMCYILHCMYSLFWYSLY